MAGAGTGERSGAKRRRWAATVGFERLEARALLAGISGIVQRSVDVSGLDALDPATFPAIPNVTVRLDNGASQVTGQDGSYSFANVAPGRYQVSVVLPVGYLGTTAQSLSYTVTVGADDVNGLNFGLATRNEAILQNLYELVLHRPATADEFTAGVGRLAAGGSVAAEFGRLTLSAEFRQSVEPIAGLVRAFYPGVLDIGAVRSSVRQQQLGIRQDATVQAIMSSQKFVAANGDVSRLSNTAYVQFLYRKLLNRAATAGQVNAAVTRLNAGTTRPQIAVDLVRSAAFQGRGPLLRTYRGAITYLAVLGREATPAEVLAFAASRISTLQLATRLSRSAEFRGLQGFTSTAYWDARAYTLTPPVQPLDRLQAYNPVTRAFDLPVTAGSITSSAATPRNVYVVAHGWAPGDSQAVLLGSTPGNPLRSWAATPPVPAWLTEPTAQVSSTGLAQAIVEADPAAVVVAYSWLDLSATPLAAKKAQAFLNTSAASGATTLDVGDTSALSVGMKVFGLGIPANTVVQNIISPTQVTVNNATTQVLSGERVLFVGIDIDSLLDSLLYVGQSESRTQWAGLMLASAVQQALGENFFGSGQGLLHMIGHSHGSKVAAIATVALEAASMPVSQLSLFESPETGPSVPSLSPPPLGLAGLGGGQNFIWRVLQQLPSISRTPVASGRQATGGTFVENYYSTSGFGAAVAGHTGLANVVDVTLRPGAYYNPTSTSAGAFGAMLPSHQYPAAWYAQASLQNPAGPAYTRNGLSWSPLLNAAAASGLAAAYDQFPQTGTATPAEFLQRQFELAATAATPAQTVSAMPLAYALQSTVGNVSDTGSLMTLSVGGGTSLSMVNVGFVPLGSNTDAPMAGTGLELNVTFSGVDPGETVQLVASIHGVAAPRALGVFNLAGTTGLMSMPVLTLDGTAAGSGQRIATISLDGFNANGVIAGPFSNPANLVSQLSFSLIAAPGSAASVTLSNMRQFGTPLPG